MRSTSHNASSSWKMDAMIAAASQITNDRASLMKPLTALISTENPKTAIIAQSAQFML